MEQIREAWMTLDWDVANWNVLMEECGVDKTARMDLTLLSQFSEVGAQAANQILSKLLKKVADGETFNNPSAFVHSRVLNSRNELWNQLKDFEPPQRGRGWKGTAT